eukprot:scaffold456_cov368-Pavlova_lutheri.AAC.34
MPSSMHWTIPLLSMVCLVGLSHSRPSWDLEIGPGRTMLESTTRHNDEIVLRDCLVLYRSQGFNLRSAFDSFAGYLKRVKVPFDFLSELSEATFLLKDNNLTYTRKKRMALEGIINNIVDLFNVTKNDLGIKTLPEVAFHLNTWDTGYPDANSLAKGKIERFCLHDADVNYVACSGTIALPIHGNQDLNLLADYLQESMVLNSTSWNKRKDQAVWRGGNNQHRGERSKLMQIARASGGLIDASFSYLPWSKFVSYKVIIAVDGFGPFSGAFKRALLSGSPIVQVGHYAGYGEWFEPLLQPYVHYVPCRFDMGDLVEKVKWLLHDKKAAVSIAKNAAAAARFLFQKKSITCYTYAALSYWSSVEDISLPSKGLPFKAGSTITTVPL